MEYRRALPCEMPTSASTSVELPMLNHVSILSNNNQQSGIEAYPSSRPFGRKRFMLASNKVEESWDAWTAAAPSPTPIWPIMRPIPAAPGL